MSIARCIKPSAGDSSGLAGCGPHLLVLLGAVLGGGLPGRVVHGLEISNKQSQQGAVRTRKTRCAGRSSTWISARSAVQALWQTPYARTKSCVCRAVLTLPLVAPLARPLPSSFRPEAVEALRLHRCFDKGGRVHAILVSIHWPGAC